LSLCKSNFTSPTTVRNISDQTSQFSKVKLILLKR
jgi:hypothetical protein